MASRAKFNLPPNWKINAISWVAGKVGQNYGTFAASIQGNEGKREEIEEAYKQELLRRYTEEQKMLNAAKSLSSRQKRNHKSEGDEIRYA